MDTITKMDRVKLAGLGAGSTGLALVGGGLTYLFATQNMGSPAPIIVGGLITAAAVTFAVGTTYAAVTPSRSSPPPPGDNNGQESAATQINASRQGSSVEKYNVPLDAALA